MSETNEELNLGNVIHIPIEPHFAGDYRLEYDSKYVVLFGKDKRYKAYAFGKLEGDFNYEEMILDSLVAEVRNANPKIKKVTDKHIEIDLGCV